jgi:hypothetical protein
MMETVAEHVPEADRILLLADTPDGFFDPTTEHFSILPANELKIPGLRKLAFALDPTALCCALKAPLVLHALTTLGYTRVIYADNDVLFFRSPDELLAAVEEHSVVVTPHICGPVPDGVLPSELIILRSGIFNAGLFAARATEPSRVFFRWWSKMMQSPGNLRNEWSYDQPWLGYALAFVPDATCLRNLGYNVSSWNLDERPIAGHGSLLTAAGIPLTAFHFSGFDETRPTRLHLGNPSCNYPETPAISALLADYGKRLVVHGRDQCRSWTCEFGCFEDGTTVTVEQREHFSEQWWRTTPDEADPFALDFAPPKGKPGDLRLWQPPTPPLIRRLKKTLMG